MKKPDIEISFDEQMGSYKAEDRGYGLCTGFGNTPDEAVAWLEELKTRMVGRECCESARIQKNTGDCRCPKRSHLG